MKTLYVFRCVCIFIICVLIPSYGIGQVSQEKYEESITVAFPDPSQSGRVEVFSGRGDITVTGYSGNEVIINTISDRENILESQNDEKAKGLNKIFSNSFNIYTEDDQNSVVISRSVNEKVDLFIQVPINTSLIIGKTTSGTGSTLFIPSDRQKEVQSLYEREKSLRDRIEQEESLYEKEKLLEDRLKQQQSALQTYTGVITGFTGFIGTGNVIEGNIEVRDVFGELEIGTLKGDITLTDISGCASISTTNGDILITFKNVTEDKPMYFSTVNGDIDVSFPADIKAELPLKCVEGNMYTDFELTMKRQLSDTGTQQFIGGNGFNAENLILSNKSPVVALINGGGPEISFTTIRGNIYIRKRQ